MELTLTANARRHPAKAAVVMTGSGEVLRYDELEERSSRLARALEARGIGPGDKVAAIMENRPTYAEVAWACRRLGASCVPVNWHLSPAEAAYIVDDSGARAVVASAVLGELPKGLRTVAGPQVVAWLAVGGEPAGYEPYETALAAVEGGSRPGDGEGAPMFYSSGTTGRPKGIQHPKPSQMAAMVRGGSSAQRMPTAGEDDSYLIPAPLYHAAPYASLVSTTDAGGTAVVMERFDPVAALAAIERYRVDGGQFVPTMFVRMLKLPPEERARFDLSSLRFAIHAAAPCPVDVKQAMLDWWGPIVWEYYSATEAIGHTVISPQDWLRKPGSVGRPSGCTIHVLDEEGTELGPGGMGVIYFDGGQATTYHNDPERTRATTSPEGWRTVGDIGFVDEDGYLFLTDRKDFMIVSGGVNIYPREAEDVLTLHPKVADVAVFGVPDEDMGEAVKAAVQLADGVEPSDAVAEELLAHCRSRLAHYKCPRTVDFVPELPRLPTGKLAKHLLREPYWRDRGMSRIV